MTAAYPPAMTAEPTAQPVNPPSVGAAGAGAAGSADAPREREKTAIPRNPGRRDLGMKATLLFPDNDIVERFYVTLIYTACRTCYLDLDARSVLRLSVDRQDDTTR